MDSSSQHSRITDLFVGREPELRELSKHLAPRGQARTVLIHGDVGIGKTTLAQVFVRRHGNRYPAGVVGLTLGGHPFLFAGDELTAADGMIAGLRPGRSGGLVILDEAHLPPQEKLTRLIQRLTASRPTTQILALSQVILPGFDRVISLGPMTSEEMKQMLAKRNAPLAGADIQKLSEFAGGSPLAALDIAVALSESGNSSLEELLADVRDFRVGGVVGPDGTPLSPGSTKEALIIRDVEKFDRQLLTRLERTPELVYELSPRAFEQLVAKLLAIQGYEVELTKATRDGGKDLYAARKDAVGTFVFVVECKRFSPDRPVGVGLVRQLYGVVQRERVTGGILATTSYFSREAKEFQQPLRMQLSLRDYLALQAWLRNAVGVSIIH